jgi:hypothetical protein
MTDAEYAAFLEYLRRHILAVDRMAEEAIASTGLAESEGRCLTTLDTATDVDTYTASVNNKRKVRES